MRRTLGIVASLLVFFASFAYAEEAAKPAATPAVKAENTPAVTPAAAPVGADAGKKEASKTEAQATEVPLRFGAGPFFMVLFNEHDSHWGNYGGPGLMYGLRGTYYLGKDSDWRVGILVAGGGASSDGNVNLEGPASTLYSQSTKRSIWGGYGAATAEYVLRAGSYVDFPIGLGLGGGYSAYISELRPRKPNPSNIKTEYRDEESFMAVQPMVGVEANITDWLRFSVTASYLLSEPFGGERYLSGFGLAFGLAFGQFSLEPKSAAAPAPETKAEKTEKK